MKVGENELGHVFWTAFMQLSKLSNFYSIMLKGLPHGTNKQMSELEATTEMLCEDGTLASWLTNPEKIDNFCEMIKKQMPQIYQRTESDAKRMLDATAIVFAHGILDACVYGYLEVLSLASPESFKIYTQKKQVSLSDVESKSCDQLYEGKIKEFMTGTVENSSLMYKLDKLLEITKPTSAQMNPEHKYDKERLVKFDKARHDIVHGNNWKSYSIDFTNELYYWNLLNFYFIALVARTTGLKISQESLSKISEESLK